MTSRRVRSKIVPPEKLDEELLSLQKEGKTITNIIACPSGMSFSSEKQNTRGEGQLDINLVIIYSEEVVV